MGKTTFINDLVYFTTRVPDTSDTSQTQTTRVCHECGTSATRMKRVKICDFESDTSKNTFSHPYISYIANERL